MANNSCWPNNQSWGHYWPRKIMALTATNQVLFSFAILGLHIVIVVFGIAGLCYNVISWYIMGFVCWAFFLACWISVFAVTCCYKSSVGCATYVMIKNIVAFVFSAVLIDFDRQFIDSQGYLYVTGSTITSCLNNLHNSNINSAGSDNGNIDYIGISLSLAKGQLAASVIILVSSLVYIGIYIYVYIRALRDHQNMPNNGITSGVPLPPRASKYETPQPRSYQADAFKLDGNRGNVNYQTGPAVCHYCGAKLNISQQF